MFLVVAEPVQIAGMLACLACLSGSGRGRMVLMQAGTEGIQCGSKGRLRSVCVVFVCVVKAVAECVQRGREGGGVLNVVVHDGILIV